MEAAQSSRPASQHSYPPSPTPSPSPPEHWNAQSNMNWQRSNRSGSSPYDTFDRHSSSEDSDATEKPRRSVGQRTQPAAASPSFWDSIVPMPGARGYVRVDDDESSKSFPDGEKAKPELNFGRAIRKALALAIVGAFLICFLWWAILGLPAPSSLSSSSTASTTQSTVHGGAESVHSDQVLADLHESTKGAHTPATTHGTPMTELGKSTHHIPHQHEDSPIQLYLDPPQGEQDWAHYTHWRTLDFSNEGRLQTRVDGSAQGERADAGRRRESEEIGESKRDEDGSAALRGNELKSKEGRLIFVGDVHGSYDELRRLLHHLSFHPSRDTLLLVGDLVAKGPQSGSLDVLSYISALRASHRNAVWAVRGNHDEPVIEWAAWMSRVREDARASGGDAAVKEVEHFFQKGGKKGPKGIERLTGWTVPGRWEWGGDHFELARHANDAQIRALRDHPLLLRIPQLSALVVHAGILAPKEYTGVPPRSVKRGSFPPRHNRRADPDEDEAVRALLTRAPPQNAEPYTLLEMRSVLRWPGDPDGALVAKKKHKGTPWADGWSEVMRSCAREHSDGCEPLSVLYGHAAARGLDVHPYSLGIDTGCVYGRQLTALVLPVTASTQRPSTLEDNEAEILVEPERSSASRPDEWEWQVPAADAGPEFGPFTAVEDAHLLGRANDSGSDSDKQDDAEGGGEDRAQDALRKHKFSRRKARFAGVHGDLISMQCKGYP